MQTEKMSLYTAFEDQVTNEIEKQSDITRTDAQSLIEANEDVLMNGFISGDMPENVAAQILQQ